MSSRRPLAALIFAAILSSGTASAQIPSANRDEALQLGRQGQEALKDGHFAAAADLFARAEALVHAPTLLIGLARARVGLKQWLAALDVYEKIASEGVPPGSTPAFAKAVAAAQEEMDELRARIPSVVIEVKGPATSKVTIDGTALPSAEIGTSRRVDPGEHKIQAEAQGFTTAETTVTVVERQVEKVTLTLSPQQSAPPPEPPRSRKQAPENIPASQAPIMKRDPLPPQTTEYVAVTSPMKSVGIAAVSLGAAGFVASVITASLAAARRGAVIDTCPDGMCVGKQSVVDDFHRKATASTISFVAGGVLAGTGVVLLVLAAKTSATQKPPVNAVLGPGFVSVQGRF